MARQDLGEKTVRELRVMAKKAGIAVKGYLKKKDLVKALSLKKKPAAKQAKPATPTKKVPSGKTEDKRNISRKTAGKGAIKKSIKKTQSAKQKSVSLKVPPTKTPLTDFVSEEVNLSPEFTLPPLPAEYSGDKIVSMQVTPGRIYVYWEVPEDRLVKYKGSLNIKVLDVKANYFFYTPVSGRIGESFINIKPDSDYAVEIGIIDSRGEFFNIIQPPEPTSVAEGHSGAPGETPARERHEMAGPKQKGEAALPEEFFEMPETVSSY